MSERAAPEHTRTIPTVTRSSPTLATVWLDVRRRRGGVIANAAALALIAAFISEAAFNHWNVDTVAVQVAATVLLAVGTFLAALVVAVWRLEAKLESSKRDVEVMSVRTGIHKGLAAVLEGVAESGDDDVTQLQWLARRAVEVLRTDRYLSEEKVQHIEAIVAETSSTATERLAKLEEHLRERLLDGRYLLP